MFSTLLQDGNKEAKTSVVLRFAKWTVIPQLSNYKLQHQFFLLIFCNFFSPWPFHGPVHSPCRAMTTRTQLSWLPPLFTKATDTRYAEARSPLLFGEVLTKASAVFPLEHKRPAAFDLQVYRSDWHSCLEFVDFPIFHNLKGCLKKYFTVDENVWLELWRIEATQSNAKTALLHHGLDYNLRSCH